MKNLYIFSKLNFCSATEQNVFFLFSEIIKNQHKLDQFVKSFNFISFFIGRRLDTNLQNYKWSGECSFNKRPELCCFRSFHERKL